MINIFYFKVKILWFIAVAVRTTKIDAGLYSIAPDWQRTF